jgi:hypothetical protein
MTASAIVACSSGSPNSVVASLPGAKKSMIRPIAHGIPRLTPVETVRKTTPDASRGHWGLASARRRRSEAVSGVFSSLLLDDEEGVTAEEDGGGVDIEVEGDGGWEVDIGVEVSDSAGVVDDVDFGILG